MTPKLRIVLADDHTVVREGLKSLVNTQPDMELVGEASDGRSAVELASALAPDVVVMDISMPDIGGAEATEMIRRQCPNVRVLALTVHEVDGYLRRLIEVGASGYILKRAAAEELLNAIRVVASGGISIDQKMAMQAVVGMVPPSSPQERAEDVLTERETEVVKLLARGHINREIADQLDLSVKTIEVHKARALEKLGLRSRADLVRYSMKQGWLHAP
jgi:DNA-binding NarL/FixJ family response regulator